jgi:hypothetical protein
MALASLDDINAHLPSIAQITDLVDDQLQLDAERIVKGYLSNVYSAATLAAWAIPTQTPGLIRSIAGRLIAAWFYASKTAGDVAGFPDYSQNKYNEAIALLEQIRSGDIVLTEVVEEAATGERFTINDFYPNDIEDPAPMFSINDAFA